MRVLSLNLSLPLNITPWWDMNYNAGVYYREFQTSHFNENPVYDLVNFTMNSTQSFVLPNNWSIELTGVFNSRETWVIFTFRPKGSLDIGIQKELKHDKGSLRLAFTDVFNTNNWKVDTRVAEANINSYIQYDWNSRGFFLSYSMNFGNYKLKSVTLKSGADEERKRVGN